jgi:hypothetical protein
MLPAHLRRSEAFAEDLEPATAAPQGAAAGGDATRAALRALTDAVVRAWRRRARALPTRARRVVRACAEPFTALRADHSTALRAGHSTALRAGSPTVPRSNEAAIALRTTAGR